MASVMDGRPTNVNHAPQFQNTTIHQTLTEKSQTLQNSTSQGDCIEVVFSEMEYLPWNNPDNIVSAEVEEIVRQVKNNLLVVFFLVGGPANVINMLVFHKQGLKDRVNLCLFALSLVDGLYLFNTVLHHGEQVYFQFTTKEMFGPVSTLLSNINMGCLLHLNFVSSVLSAIIAVERCLCVFNPLKCQAMLNTKTMATIIIVGTIVIMSLLFIVSFRYRVGCVYDPVIDMTVVTSVEGKFYKAHKEFIDVLENFIFGVGLLGLVMMTVVVTTVMTIVKLRQIVRWRSESSSSISTQELALTKTLVANSIFFIICLFPFAVNRVLWLCFPEINGGRRLHNTFLMSIWIEGIFSYINATFNIFVYYLMGSRYRETFSALFGRMLRPRK